jgi:hypothetical protein
VRDESNCRYCTLPRVHDAKSHQYFLLANEK